VEQLAVQLCEQEGIVFIDEIDKIVVPQGQRSKDVSAEGVQQDLLPIIDAMRGFGHKWLVAEHGHTHDLPEPTEAAAAL
jgi:ATP-dependent protease HslVU (ClpYQ) ATPase subunit